MHLVKNVFIKTRIYAYVFTDFTLLFLNVLGDRSEEGAGHDGAAAQGHPAQVQQATARALGNHQDPHFEYAQHHTYILRVILLLLTYSMHTFSQ